MASRRQRKGNLRRNTLRRGGGMFDFLSRPAPAAAAPPSGYSFRNPIGSFASTARAPAAAAANARIARQSVLPSPVSVPKSRFSMPSWSSAPAVDPSLKTSVGFLKSVVEGKNWARATPNATNATKFIFADEPETSDDRVWTGKAGISEKRGTMGLPEVYYDQEFSEYNTKPPIWTNFKNASGKWIEPKNVPRITSKGRFYGKMPANVRNTMKAFKNSYLSKQKNDYTRRYDAKMVQAKAEWAKITATQKKEIDTTLSKMNKEYKDYLSSLQKDVESAYSQQTKDLIMTKRVELQEAADKFKVEQGYNPGQISVTGNVKKNVKLMNSMRAAAAKTSGPVVPAAPAAPAAGLGGLLGFAEAPVAAPAVVAAPVAAAPANVNLLSFPSPPGGSPIASEAALNANSAAAKAAFGEPNALTLGGRRKSLSRRSRRSRR